MNHIVFVNGYFSNPLLFLKFRFIQIHGVTLKSKHFLLLLTRLITFHVYNFGTIKVIFRLNV